MNDCTEYGFQENFPGINNKDYKYVLLDKMIVELHFLERGYVCAKWHDITPNGCMAEFRQANIEDKKRRLRELEEMKEKLKIKLSK